MGGQIYLAYTDKDVSKTFSDFPLWEYRIAFLLLVLSNSVLPEREIQEMFY